MIWVVADIHGCVFTLESIIKRVRQADLDAQFVFTGDYVDRGKHNKEVVDFVIGLQYQGAVCLRGNHDDVFSYILGNQPVTDVQDFASDKTWHALLRWWSYNGFLPTAASYGISGELLKNICVNPSEVIDTIRDNAPEEHQRFFNGLPMTWENETHFAVHSYLPPDWEGPRHYLTVDQKTEMVWNRFPRGFTGTLQPVDLKWKKIGVLGHTPVKYYSSAAPIKYKQMRLIDCGAFIGEYLCAYCVQKDDWILEATDVRDQKENVNE
jgi:serine/threonine protein phosphatase 1